MDSKRQTADQEGSPSVPLHADEAVAFALQMLDETDRGCVLTVSAFLETQLRDALICKCRKMSNVSEKELNLLFKTFDSQFANFASCIRLAHAMGIILSPYKDMLLQFGVWRNKFAHHKHAQAITESDLTFVEFMRSEFDKDPEYNKCHGDPSHSAGRTLFIRWGAVMYVTLSNCIKELQEN